MSALNPGQQPTVLFSIYQNNTRTIRWWVDERIDPVTQSIILKIVGFLPTYYALARKMCFMCFSLFWPKEVHFKAKIDSFLTFILTNFLGNMSFYSTWDIYIYITLALVCLLLLCLLLLCSKRPARPPGTGIAFRDRADFLAKLH